MPSSIGWPALCLTALMVTVTGYHVHRALGGHGGRRDIDVTHAAMGTAMALMLTGTLPGSAARALSAGFAAATLWFGCAAVRRYVLDGHGRVGVEACQVAACAAMTYMLALAAGLRLPSSAPALPGAAMPGMAMGATGGAPIAAALLVAAVFAAAAWTLRTLARPDGAPVGDHGPLAAGCQVAMHTTAVYMLLAAL